MTNGYQNEAQEGRCLFERHHQREVQDDRWRFGSLFRHSLNVKPNGDWLAVRYNDTENNVALWEFHNGVAVGQQLGPNAFTKGSAR